MQRTPENADAQAYLGILMLQEGRIDDALSKLLSAEKNQTTLPDAYAAISQIYKMGNNIPKADRYIRIFRTKSQVDDPQDLFVSNKPIEDIERDSLSLLNKISNPMPDSLRRDNSPTKDTSIAETTSIKKSDTTVADVPKTNILNTFLQGPVFYGTAIALLFLLTLASSYLRWRKKKLSKAFEKNIADRKAANAKPVQSQKQKIVSKKSSNQDTTKQNLAKQKMASKLYQSNSVKENQALQATKADIDPDEQNKFAPKPKAQVQSQKISTTRTASAMNFDEKLAVIAAKLAERRQEEQDDIYYSEVSASRSETREKPQKRVSLPPKVELALHLQQEQQKIKTRNIDTFSDKEIPMNGDELTEVARRLGVEKNSLETKANLSRLSTDEKSLSKLKEKFSNSEKKIK